MTSQPVQTWASAEAVSHWREGAARRATVLHDATEQMLDAAGLRPGARVLDLAAGSGDQTVVAARRVGPTGSVLAIDISASMIAAAQEAFRAAGLTNVETLVSDITDLHLEPESFDAAICRLGLMFLPSPEAGLRRIREGLKPGSRLGALVWSSADRNPYMSTVVSIVREMGKMPDPPPTILRAMSLGAPGALERALVAAGFEDVSVRPVPIVRDFASVDETIELLREGSSPQQELLSGLSEGERKEVWQQAARRLQAFRKQDGRVSIPGEALLGTGKRPSR
ncbi:MAG: methyltransferase domain-containing protein [Chloroflexi bacterium]|nr:methyltransferase domain-containing protein [Chloroflexota bacterium]